MTHVAGSPQHLPELRDLGYNRRFRPLDAERGEELGVGAAAVAIVVQGQHITDFEVENPSFRPSPIAPRRVGSLVLPSAEVLRVAVVCIVLPEQELT